MEDEKAPFKEERRPYRHLCQLQFKKNISSVHTPPPQFLPQRLPLLSIGRERNQVFRIGRGKRIDSVMMFLFRKEMKRKEQTQPTSKEMKKEKKRHLKRSVHLPFLHLALSKKVLQKEATATLVILPYLMKLLLLLLRLSSRQQLQKSRGLPRNQERGVRERCLLLLLHLLLLSLVLTRLDITSQALLWCTLDQKAILFLLLLLFKEAREEKEERNLHSIILITLRLSHSRRRLLPLHLLLLLAYTLQTIRHPTTTPEERQLRQAWWLLRLDIADNITAVERNDAHKEMEKRTIGIALRS